MVQASLNLGAPPPKILVIDDEPSIVSYLEEFLTAHHYEVITAENGAQGIDQAVKTLPDLVLLDIMLPNQNGFQVCTTLKEDPRTSNIPILLLTALQSSEDKIAGLDSGADDFITKPFKAGEILARVRAFLRTKQLRDQLEQSYEKLKKLDELKESLTEMIIHDLKVPLTTVRGNISLIQDVLSKEGLPVDLQRFLGALQRGCDRIVNLINDLIDVGRLEQNKFPIQKASVDPILLVRNVLEAVEPIKERRQITFKSSLSEKAGTVALDEGVIQRVLSNLLANSIKFTKPDGKIQIAVQALPEQQLEFSIED